ncbi:uncharacterized protein LY89DRAFT_152081 [Mollisia scopiformis]|uniref:Uncharacterized protein n=1 Tax=Mollisia scopiformis TaxID=149040 RepID=A0A194X1F4_MOLSC|nr:uncharacterized protein LY89DRAFT_152081 [Mollisia scopiformis]KUJ14030.1 hypothetical protein LY89DRAFT_152081 [Mollisia scopiformis]
MLTSPMWFLKELELYKHVKPYRLDFDPEDDNFPRTNVDRVEIPGVPIHDIRGNEDQLLFPKCGFSILHMPSSLTTLDYDDHDLVTDRYYSFIEKAVQDFSEKSHLGAKVVALDHKVRKRHSTFPISNGENYSDPQPVMVAHVDWTPQTIEKKLRLTVGDEKTKVILGGQYQFCHAWRPLFGPLRGYPLAVCDYSTVNPENDYEITDDVYENHGVDENYMVYHRPGHKWYYLSDQEPTEILLFREYDSTVGLMSGIPHCAIPNPVPSEHIMARQSIEVELVIYWP